MRLSSRGKFTAKRRCLPPNRGRVNSRQIGFGERRAGGEASFSFRPAFAIRRLGAPASLPASRRRSRRGNRIAGQKLKPRPAKSRRSSRACVASAAEICWRPRTGCRPDSSRTRARADCLCRRIIAPARASRHQISRARGPRAPGNFPAPMFPKMDVREITEARVGERREERMRKVNLAEAAQNRRWPR